MSLTRLPANFYLVALLMGTCLWSVHGLADDTGLPVDQRMDVLGKLIETSSAAKQVEGSGSDQARALRDEAREYYQQARAAQASGRGENVSSLLDQAAHKMFLAIGAARPKQKIADKKLADYEQRKRSVDSLLEAQQRISREKGLQEEADNVRYQVEGLLSTAGKLQQRGEQEGAGILLQQAYSVIKVSLESLRGGETLVKTLQFDTEEDEYLYELDRNDTHFMLARMLAEQGPAQGAIGGKSTALYEMAEDLRSKAEKKAVQQHYSEAINLLEESTRQLVRVIRSNGVYIPG